MKIISRKSYHIIWIISLLIIIAVKLPMLCAFWNDTYWFLIEVPRLAPINLPSFDGSRVWQASKGVVLLFSTIVFFVILIVHIVKLKREILPKANINK